MHRLIIEDLIERPASDAYILGLITLPQIYRDRAALDAEIARDPGILQVLPRLFEIEGTADCCLASVEKYSGGPRPVRDAIRYAEAFTRSETVRDRSDYEGHHLHLIQLLEYLKEEYKKIESKVGLPLEKIL